MFAKFAFLFALTFIIFSISSAEYSKECGPNEEYNSCGSACPQPTCGNSTSIPKVCTQQCVQGCFCTKGYIRRNGKCISQEECDNTLKLCKENEYWDKCGTDCPEFCGEPEAEICNEKCVQGCFCDPGYVKQRNGSCISVEECKIKTTCKKNEHWTTCHSHCSPICGQTEPIICPAVCIEGCACNRGFVKLNDQCISKEECNNYTQCRKNEHWDTCSSSCPAVCGEPEPDFCDKKCVQECVCNTGYIRHNGQCIPEEECKKITTCNKNEHWENCGTACPKICKGPDSEVCTMQCVQGCFCNSGYVRRNGKCILEEECEKQTRCKRNEHWTNCGSACPKICGLSPPKSCSTRCVEGCVCDEGYEKLKDKCISEAKCKEHIYCKQNEYWSDCGTACPAVCAQEPVFCRARCRPGCFCKPGFILRNGTCISEAKCKEYTLCKANEYWTNCGTACPATCTEKPQVCTKQCVPGCFCKPGYIRKDKVCVPECDC